ncbi:exodeoxyribonuclease III [Sulfurifustis variabilis]|uniref:Exodeoxyribonuclease III n=1 Tax=Sulfurifustis variabilis TaxID=1675686 RepID=A0A1B4VCR4_9GAMM|nr:exodeoxyribonuclease III [Sulfurifustis variabilis]BAU46717.1 exodeoxyribonuclease III [Sulfurifustis variabilis]
MKLATWNVNSIRARLPHVLDWLDRQRPDVACLQETKVPDEEFPKLELQAAGYVVLHAGQKGYNGVATLVRHSATEVLTEAPGLDSGQKRFLAATIAGVRVLNVYVPNGERVGSPKYAYKLEWLEALRAWLAGELARHERLVIVGDFNIAPEDRDVYEPKLWRNQVLFSEPERDALRSLVGLGLVDLFRRFTSEAGHYTWWDYRAGAFRRNQGLRIDHILASPALAARAKACFIDREPRGRERPSDHAPVVADLDTD